MIELGVFGWQTWIVQWKRDIYANRRGRIYTPLNIHENQYAQVDWTQYYQSPEEYFFFGGNIFFATARSPRAHKMLGRELQLDPTARYACESSFCSCRQFASRKRLQCATWNLN